MRPDPFGAIRNGQGPGIAKRTLPLGTIVLRSDLVNGKRQLVRMVKIRMDGPCGLRWMLYARWWWLRNRGSVPAGKRVIHLDGNELNDKPENLAVGSPGDVVVLAHMRKPEWSKEQHRRCAAGTAAFNRFAGKLNRLRTIIANYWYPVLDSEGLIFNAPFRRRKKLLEWFGVDVAGYPSNGRARKFIDRHLEDNEVRAVRGRNLGDGILSTFIRLDPEFCVNATGEKLSDEDELRIKRLKGTETWKRAEAAALSDLRVRK